MFGKDVSMLKGKETRPHPFEVNQEDIVELPPELRISETELAADVLFIEGQAFITSIDRKVKFEGVVPMGNYKKLTKEQWLVGVDEVIHHYAKKGIEITWLHLDNEFRKYKTEMEKRWKLERNFAAPDEHVPDVERLNRTIQDRF